MVHVMSGFWFKLLNGGEKDVSKNVSRLSDEKKSLE